jgi:hypothetical protein
LALNFRIMLGALDFHLDLLLRGGTECEDEDASNREA